MDKDKKQLHIEGIKSKLTEAVLKVVRIVTKNSTLPILSCIYFQAQNGELIIKSTNLDLGIEVSVPVKIIHEGIVAVPGDLLSSYLTTTPTEGKLEIKQDGGNLLITTNNSSTKIKTFPFDDFPSIPHLSLKKSFTVPAVKIIEGLKAVSYSAAVSSMKPELSSIYMYVESNNLVFVATDSFRLAEKRISVESLEEFDSLLIPFKNISEIIRLLDTVSGDIQILHDQNQVAFMVEGMYIVSRVIDGMFPDYKQIIPKEFSTEITLLKDEFVSIVRSVIVFSDKFNKISLKTDIQNKQLVIETKNNELGESIYTIESVVEGDDISISYNYKNIIDCFDSISSDSVVFNFAGVGKPMIIKGVGDSSFFYLVMPMNK